MLYLHPAYLYNPLLDWYDDISHYPKEEQYSCLHNVLPAYFKKDSKLSELPASFVE